MFQILFFVLPRCINFSFLQSKDSNFPDEDEAPIDILPDELLIEIFKLLPLDELLQCENVCRRWRKVARDAVLWRRIIIVCSGQLGEISEKNLEIIDSHRKWVHCLKIQYILNYPVIKSVTNKCSNLISLELIMCRIEKEFDEDIKKWVNLRKLNLKNSLLKSKVDLEIQYDQFKHLTYLGLSDFGLSSANCDSLLKCSYLCHINIEKIRGLSLDFIKLLIETKKHILVTLHINGGKAVDDECLFMLAQCPALKDLAIIRCECLTDKALISLSNMMVIEQLQLWNNDIFSEIALIKTLECPQLTKLKSLSLSRIKNVSPVIVDVISESLKSLKFLALYQCPKIINTDYEKQLKSKFRNIDVVLY